jgi:enhancer of polycomb-like protein
LYIQYDETNETPYVCFRRREVKVARKTRRTDTQTIERLVRLKSDLASAQELLLKVLERERCKREVYLAEARIFESRVQMRELKRKLKESAGDESILVARREKRRRREDMSGQPG